MSIIKQIYINKIKLPSEIKDIIKSFIFNNINNIIKKQLKKKNKICYLIKNTKFSGSSYINEDIEIFRFYIKNERNIYRFKLCKKCGDYLTCSNYYEIPCKIKCNCND